MTLTPGQVKNLMRRGLRFLVDPEPKQADKLRIKEYFQHRCAYCNVTIPNGLGDIDHLISAALGGSNGLANRVLSCKPCNANEKRDQEWKLFLQRKAVSKKIFSERAKKIERWIAQNGGHPILDPTLLSVIDAESQRTTRLYDNACKKIRKAKKG